MTTRREVLMMGAGAIALSAIAVPLVAREDDIDYGSIWPRIMAEAKAKSVGAIWNSHPGGYLDNAEFQHRLNREMNLRLDNVRLVT